MYFPPVETHDSQPRHEPLSYFTSDNVNKRARRVGIQYQATTPEGQPYFGFMSRPLPTLPHDVTRRITGYITNNNRRVSGVTEEDLWKLNRKHGPTAWLVPIHAMRDEVRRLRSILDRPYPQEHLSRLRREFRIARRNLNDLESELESTIEWANASRYPAGGFRRFKDELDEGKRGARTRLQTCYENVQLCF